MKRFCGVLLIGSAVLIFFVKYYFVNDDTLKNALSFSSTIGAIFGLILITPFQLIPLIIFDNHEWESNTSIKSLIRKIRLRGILFFNISVIIFIITIMVIITGFYILINPEGNLKNETKIIEDIITIRISATALLIFLVQILFRAFKYLLRVAAFYFAKADALELFEMHPDMKLNELMDMFTPEKYDISDLTSPSFLDKLTGKAL